MTITAEDLVRREVHYCVSFLVSTLAQGYGERLPEQLNEAAEQAFELCSPIDDWEEAATQEGWTLRGEGRTGQSWRNANPEFDGFDMESAEAVCREFDIEPYQREVFEHWIVSDWLADRLAEKGEKVDKDFAGLTVWARTCTGQGIASDSVIIAIHAELTA